ncbi:MAG: F0F1 ATP synthase subunit B [Actinomyces sp.]|uniref:F0F1 ATP synthase subunit B n=1 Tax=Actinomyces sp. TaxID=29317 RepID=UPI0026DC1521|nr:F0F1 ATP synthase subunit B [Actinomyces sp.]MDO4242417.1 F0F1 ATP synthase subunit B [Actinomyces sp.]
MSVGTAVMPAASTPEGIFLFIPQLADLVWGTVCFVIIAVVLIKYALPRFNAVLDERTRRIEEGLALADKAKGDQKDAELKAARLVEDARHEAARIRENAQAEAKAILAEAREAASGEAARAMEAAERQIRADKQAAQISLRADVGLLASDLAERIIGAQLTDTELSSSVIDRFLDELEQAPADAVATSAERGRG